MNIYIRTSGGKKYGWGNVIRMINLAEYIKKKNIKIIFIINNDKNLINYFEKKNEYKYLIISRRQTEESILSNLKNSELAIIEVLNFPLNKQEIYKKSFKKIILFDDILKQKYCVDIVYCCQDKPKYKNLLKNELTKFQIGYKYFFTNSSFLKYKNIIHKKTIKKNIKNVLVVLGGGNYVLAYIKIAKYLSLLNTNLNFTFLVGFEKYNYTKKKIKLISNKFKVISAKTQIAKFFFETDVAIVGGGYTKVEAGMMQIPMLIVSTQHHQIKLSNSFSKLTNSIYLGHYKKLNNKKFLKNFELLQDFKHRKKNIITMKRKLNFNGIDKIIKDIKL